MKSTWTYNLLDLLNAARNGKSNDLESFLAQFPLNAFVNKDCSVLLVFRDFEARDQDGKRQVLNCAPEGGNFQKGITIVTFSENGSIQSNICLPNDFVMNSCKIHGQEVFIGSNSRKIETNITELRRKLMFWADFSLSELDERFESICNAQHSMAEKAVGNPKSIKIPCVGILNYDALLDAYSVEIQINGKLVVISVSIVDTAKISQITDFVERQMAVEFYKKAMLSMEVEMIELKNNEWLEIEEETGEFEPPITALEFRECISISGITFFQDCSSVIYCNDGELFGGHTIQIQVGPNGQYLFSDLGA